MCFAVADAKKSAPFLAVKFVVVELFYGIEYQFPPGFDVNAAFGGIECGGVGVDVATRFDVDALGCAEVYCVGLGVFVFFDFGNVFAVVPFAGFVAAAFKGIEFALPGVIGLVAVGLQFDFAVFSFDVCRTQTDAAVLIGIWCREGNTCFS
ncbi:Uncharacterised protein [Neisseria meningitidis]|nr:Uncharacterised protein [Neisseria meningitidis]CWT16069.1 Uncharacterised protein [Neisseria meningitidis]